MRRVLLRYCALGTVIRRCGGLAEACGGIVGGCCRENRRENCRDDDDDGFGMKIV